jgi:hypothetical protein
MKTISMRELHHATGKYVRESRSHPLVITERGTRVAVLKAFTEEEVAGRPLPRRRAADLPAVGLDSTLLISQDRDAR